MAYNGKDILDKAMRILIIKDMSVRCHRDGHGGKIRMNQTLRRGTR